MRVQNRWVDVVIAKGLIEDAARYPLEDLIAWHRTPTLIFHGTADESVPHDGSVEFVQKSTARPLDPVPIGGGDHRLRNAKE